MKYDLGGLGLGLGLGGGWLGGVPGPSAPLLPLAQADAACLEGGQPAWAMPPPAPLLAAVRTLLSLRADARQHDLRGRTVLHWAATSGLGDSAVILNSF